MRDGNGWVLTPRVEIAHYVATSSKVHGAPAPRFQASEEKTSNMSGYQPHRRYLAAQTTADRPGSDVWRDVCFPPPHKLTVATVSLWPRLCENPLIS
jgi:hypothetical protein